jgi:hypothetical protein
MRQDAAAVKGSFSNWLRGLAAVVADGCMAAATNAAIFEANRIRKIVKTARPMYLSGV